MAGTHNEAEVKRRYPVAEGRTAQTTTQEGRKMRQIPTGIHGCKTTARYSVIPKSEEVGLD